MVPEALRMRGEVLGWMGLHAIGGVVGGAIDITLMNALPIRGITAKNVEVTKGTRKTTQVPENIEPIKVAILLILKKQVDYLMSRYINMF